MLKHMICKVNTIEINNSVLVLITFKDNFPINVNLILSYDECEDTLDFFNNDYFPNINDLVNKYSQLENHLKISEITNDLNLNYFNNNIIQINLSIYEISKGLKEKNELTFQIEDFENKNIIDYIKLFFHIDIQNEMFYKNLQRKNPFYEFFLLSYFEERQKKLGF